MFVVSQPTVKKKQGRVSALPFICSHLAKSAPHELTPTPTSFAMGCPPADLHRPSGRLKAVVQGSTTETRKEVADIRCLAVSGGLIKRQTGGPTRTHTATVFWISPLHTVAPQGLRDRVADWTKKWRKRRNTHRAGTRKSLQGQGCTSVLCTPPSNQRT